MWIPARTSIPQAGHLLADGAGAADRPGRAVEGGEEAVAHRLHLAAAVQGELAPDRGVVALEQLPPAAVAELGRLLGRADDVGEEDRRQRPFGFAGAAAADEELLDLVEQRVDVAGERQVVLARAARRSGRRGSPRPSSGPGAAGTIRSPARCRTRVGTSIAGRIARTSISR